MRSSISARFSGMSGMDHLLGARALCDVRPRSVLTAAPLAGPASTTVDTGSRRQQGNFGVWPHLTRGVSQL
jgi:hypothetical protein